MAETTGSIKRSLFATFLNTTPDAAATYYKIGDGVSDAQIQYNPKITEEHYVHEDNASKSVDGYAPTMPVSAIVINGDEVFEFIDNLRKTRAILDDAETDIVNVWLYETGGPGAYPAEKQTVCIQIDDFGGPGGDPARIGYTLNYVGDPTTGTFDTGDSSFT